MGKLDAMQSPAQSATQDSAAEIVDVVGSNVLVMLISVVTTLVTSECLEYYNKEITLERATSSLTTLLGLILLRSGRNYEAQQALDKAFDIAMRELRKRH
ncbi:hypothetical protein LTR09_007255 [Extremus antarcticus]|uniref:Uncharacterized protein n=1 Tax=Extremus antarcticus TaxID=702011 RepID=A0AAJ0DJV0_9PEZI|nr:hypothetical protein LTR09_007255 [Extremus antarcticus]